VDSAVRLAGEFGVDCVILCDTSHRYEKPGAMTITVSKGADSVDFALVNLLKPGDVAVTQDYGLAAMCLARNAGAVSQDGMEYTTENIDALLFARHTARKIRSGKGRLKGPAKREKQQDNRFEETLRCMLARGLADEEPFKKENV
jgi:uncharacterized protein YaiI (UPF0178 family)